MALSGSATRQLVRAETIYGLAMPVCTHVLTQARAL